LRVLVPLVSIRAQLWRRRRSIDGRTRIAPGPARTEQIIGIICRQVGGPIRLRGNLFHDGIGPDQLDCNPILLLALGSYWSWVVTGGWRDHVGCHDSIVRMRRHC
jgi:hypothetical protein